MGRPKSKIIDAHVHLWDVRRLNYPWLQKRPALQKTFTLSDLQAAGRGCGIESVVVVEAACEPDSAVQEVRWLGEHAEAGVQGGPRIAAIIAAAPIERGEQVKAVLEEHARCPLVRGIRREIVSEEPGFCIRPDFLRGLELVAERGWSFDICVQRHQLPDADVMVRNSPGMRFVLDHMGAPDIASGTMEPWKSDLRRLSENPSVWCKLSGALTRAGPFWTPRHLEPFVGHVLDCFGPQRVMFGSDWPVITVSGAGICDWVAALRTVLATCGTADPERIFRNNAARFWGIGDDEDQR